MKKRKTLLRTERTSGLNVLTPSAYGDAMSHENGQSAILFSEQNAGRNDPLRRLPESAILYFLTCILLPALPGLCVAAVPAVVCARPLGERR